MQERVLIIIHVYMQCGLVAALPTGYALFSPGAQHRAGLTALPGLVRGGWVTYFLGISTALFCQA